MKANFVTIVLAALIFAYSCNSKPAESNTLAKTFKSKNTDSFNTAFDTMLLTYYNLRNAFINWDTTAANKYALVLQNALIDVPYTELPEGGDALQIKATGIAQNGANALDAMINVNSINDKRRFFYTVSESIYNLIKTCDYDKAVIYHKKCPMAFNGENEGWWVSQTKKIDDNPYFGKYHPKYKNAMLECGSVEDSINNMQ